MYQGPGIYEDQKGCKYYVQGQVMNLSPAVEMILYRPLEDVGWPGLFVMSRKAFDEVQVTDTPMARVVKPRFFVMTLFQKQEG